MVLIAATTFMPVMGASRDDGSELLKNCGEAVRLIDNSQATVDALSIGYCQGMVRGVADLLVLGKNLSDTYGACIPNGATTDQLIQIVHKYLTDNPTQLHEANSTLSLTALKEAYPCE